MSYTSTAKPQFESHDQAYCQQNRGSAAFAVVGTLFSLVLITASLRVNVRFRIRRNHGWDDYATLAALVRLDVEMSLCLKMNTNIL